jgi:hypothetical protein
MKKVSPPIPALEHPKLILQAFHLCKARTDVLDAETIWTSLAALADPLGIPALGELPKRIQDAQEQVDRSAQSNNFNLSEHRQQQIIPLLPDLPGKLLEIDIPDSATVTGVSGGLFPLLMHDSYAVDLTLNYEKAKFTAAELGRRLNPGGCLLPSRIQASIGQTLLLFGRPVNWPDSEKELPAVAKSFALGLLQDSTDAKTIGFVLAGEGKFLGGSIFEFESEHPDPQQRLHIVVWLDNHAQTKQLEAQGEYYYPMLQLWLSRSKIQWCAYQADLAYKEANGLYGELEKTAQDFKEVKEKQDETLRLKLEQQGQKIKNKELRQTLTDLLPLEVELGLQERLERTLKEDPKNVNLSGMLVAQLKQAREERLNKLEGWLLEIPPKTLQYAARIWDVQHKLTTININAENFADELSRLQGVGLQDVDDLRFLEQFLHRDCQRYQKQATYNLEYLATGKSLFGQMIETIRGLVAVEGQKQQMANDEAEQRRDRSLTIWVAMVGSGLAVSGISAQVKPTAAKEALNHFNFKFDEGSAGGAIGLYVVTLFYHALVGIVFALLVRVGIEWVTRRLMRRSQWRK